MVFLRKLIFSKMYIHQNCFGQVTIAPRAGRELGYVRVKMDHMKFTTGMLRCCFHLFHTFGLLYFKLLKGELCLGSFLVVAFKIVF